ncbi:unnamed protein product [Rhizopus stolonifer]
MRLLFTVRCPTTEPPRLFNSCSSSSITAIMILRLDSLSFLFMSSQEIITARLSM